MGRGASRAGLPCRFGESSRCGYGPDLLVPHGDPEGPILARYQIRDGATCTSKPTKLEVMGRSGPWPLAFRAFLFLISGQCPRHLQMWGRRASWPVRMPAPSLHSRPCVGRGG